MYVDHETMRAEIDRLGQFFQLHGDDPWLDHVAYALEDLPEDVSEQARMIMEVPAGGSFAKRVIEITTNAVAGLYGSLERVKLLHFLSQYPVTPYTYPVDQRLSRGSRPSPAKLVTLAGQAYTASINLCAEMDGGDAPQIGKAGLTASLKTHWIPITDGTPPEVNQVLEFLQLMAEPGACAAPDQLCFIQGFGRKLMQEDPELPGYPREPLGSHSLTASERDETLAKAAAASV